MMIEHRFSSFCRCDGVAPHDNNRRKSPSAAIVGASLYFHSLDATKPTSTYVLLMYADDAFGQGQIDPLDVSTVALDSAIAGGITGCNPEYKHLRPA